MDNQNTLSNDMTFKELILKLQEYVKYCLKNWFTIVLFALPFTAYQLFLRFTVPFVYPAKLTFLIDDKKGPNIGGLLGGVDALLGRQDEKLERILELAKSRRTVAKALMQKTTINGKADFLGNHFIEVEGLARKWQKDKLLANFQFVQTNPDSFDMGHKRALWVIHNTFIGSEDIKPQFVTASNRKTGIMSLLMKTNSEELSIALVKALYNSLSDYYVESEVQKERDAYNVLSAKKDSIERMLNYNDVAAAQHDDRSNSLLLNLDKVPARRYSRNNTVLNAVYVEVVKNTAIAEFALKTATPYIAPLDEPIPPLTPIRKGSFKSMAIWSILGLLIGISWVVARKAYQDQMI